MAKINGTGSAIDGYTGSAATARFRLEDGIAWPGLRIRKILHLQRLPEFCDYC